jgi:DNA invertase Pin-like site-specific DNA recombinase
MKVAIYARVSTDDQFAEKQVDALKDYCSRMSYTVFDVYVDVISGSSTSRPEFNRLLIDMRSYKFNCVAVTKLDRLGRSLQHLLSLIDEFKRKSVNFIAVTQNLDTTSATGTLLFHVMGAFAEFERNIISERTKEGLKKAKNVGKRGADKKPRQKRGGLRKPIFTQ